MESALAEASVGAWAEAWVWVAWIETWMKGWDEAWMEASEETWLWVWVDARG